ncbi:hypothetical protein [Pedobacter sp. P26]|uniref:hypothetical protein n=1 Tax=Pedobacter sp. P26 TaxID=3423956 RepID=UPI003D672503
MNADFSLRFVSAQPHIESIPGLVAAILVIPVFDTLRVFTIRIRHGLSPFTADRNHLHHRLLSLGLSHIQATAVLLLINVLFIILAISLQKLGNNLLVIVITLAMLVINSLLSLMIYRAKK